MLGNCICWVDDTAANPTYAAGIGEAGRYKKTSKFGNRPFSQANSMFLLKMNVISCGVMPPDTCGEEEANEPR